MNEREPVLPKSPVAYVDISLLAHATEDSEKVMSALQNVVSTECAEKIVVKESKLKGEYGNPIVLFKTRIDEEETVESILRYISSHLSILDKEQLLQELGLHVEDGSLYIRLDKQAAFKGDLRLCREDPVHLRIRFRKKQNEDVINICRSLGLLPPPYPS